MFNYSHIWLDRLNCFLFLLSKQINAAASFFVVAGWVKMSATRVGRRQKNLKLHWLRRSKPSPKKLNLGNIINHSQNLIIGFYLSVPDFLANSVKANKITHFPIQFCSKDFTHFTNLNSLNIVKNILQRHSQKPYSPYKFSTRNISGWSQKKNICTEPFLDT